MDIKHFIKTLIIFAAMIFVGLLGVYLVNYFDKSDQADVPTIPSSATVAK